MDKIHLVRRKYHVIAVLWVLFYPDGSGPRGEPGPALSHAALFWRPAAFGVG